MIEKIEKTDINWIRDGERAEAVVLNRPTDRLVDLLNIKLEEISDEIENASGALDEDAVKAIINTEVPPMVTSGSTTVVNTLVPPMIASAIGDIAAKPWVTTTGALLRNTRHKILVNSVATVTLPTGAQENDFIELLSTVVSLLGTTISRNGSTIMGINENMLVDIDTYFIRFDYVNGSWRLS